MNEKELAKLISTLPPDKRLAFLEALKSQKKKEESIRFDLDDILFDKQIEVFNKASDKNVVVCSRRAGKSFFVATLLIYQAMRIPDNNFLYIGLSKTAARRVIWSTITRLITDYGVDAHVDNHQLQIRFPNRSVIYIEGAKDAATIERLRGLFCQTVVLDESQAFPIGLATSLVQDVLLPSLSDYDGQLFLTGTPDPLLQSVLYRAWEGTQKGWIGFKRFGWNVTDNKKFPRFVSGKSTPETYLQEIMDKTGYTADSPTFRREYLGEFVKSEGSLVYEFNYDRNTVEDLPSGVQWLYVMSGDVGFRDSDAIVVVAFSYFHPVAYVVEEFSKSGLSADEFVIVYKDLYDKYKPISNVIDFAGGGLKIIETLNQRFKMHCKPCKKFNPKSIGAAVLSNEFISKRLMVLKSCDTLISQLESITWISKTDRDGNVKQIIPDGFQVRDAFGEVVSDDCADSLLYALNELRNYNAVELTEDTSVEAEVKKHKEALLRRVKERKERENSNDNFFY